MAEIWDVQAKAKIFKLLELIQVLINLLEKDLDSRIKNIFLGLKEKAVIIKEVNDFNKVKGHFVEDYIFMED